MMILFSYDSIHDSTNTYDDIKRYKNWIDWIPKDMLAFFVELDRMANFHQGLSRTN